MKMTGRPVVLRGSGQVRHAYVEASWSSGWTLLAGQTSDVISPLASSTLNYVVAWWSGNIGYRRPQLRASKESALGPASLTVTGALTRTIGDDFATEPGDTGAGSGVPTVQGRVALSWPLGDGRASVGIHAHRGRETLTTRTRATSLQEAGHAISRTGRASNGTSVPG